MVKYIDIYKAEEVLARQTWLNNIDLITAVGALKLLVPAADVVEVRHGRWVKELWSSKSGAYYNVYRCSKCNAAYMEIEYGYRYCPNCGARMDLDEVE